MPGIIKAPNSDNTYRVVIDQLDQGWNTHTFPHLISDRQLTVADNVIFNREGLVSKRPGNVLYGGGSGATGSGSPILAMTRFYPVGAAAQLIVHSGTKLYKGNDGTGAFTQINASMSGTQRAHFVQVYDPDMSSGAATALVICDGSRIPQLYDGTNFVPVSTAGGFLPNGRGGSPITPKYVINWKYHLVYAGESTEPTAAYIADALRPERFTGYGITDSAGTSYTAYFPAGRDGTLGAITGLATVGPALIFFYTSGIVVGINTGTYGSFQYEFIVLSTTTGCPAPESIVSFEGFVVFFGGDRFYATDGNSVVPLPDLIPSVYGNNAQSAFPSEMFNKSGVVGVRRGLQYWASYDNQGNGNNTAIAVFDISAANGWTYGAPQGGAWSRWISGMPLNCGIECRGPGDSKQPMFWGASNADLVAQHDTGVYGDFGNATACEIRCKAFYLDRPIWPKDVQALYVLTALQTQGASYSDLVTPYIITDSSSSIAPSASIGVNPAALLYGSGAKYGTFLYGALSLIITGASKTYPQQDCKGNVLQPGFVESSTNPINFIGFVMDVIIDEPNP